MASNTAEHFVVTNELGGSTTGERAATIASVISGAATLTATNTLAAASLASGHRSAPRFC